jgi:hypothetical protein
MDKPKKKVFEINNPIRLSECINFISDLPFVDKSPFQVIITRGADLRSIEQNSLYWKHMNEIEKATGQNLHLKLKRKFLHPIYMRGDTEKNIQYQLNFQALCTIKEAGVNVDFEMLHDKILSTTDATVKQFAEYIDAYWPYINSKGIYLTNPDDK